MIAGTFEINRRGSDAMRLAFVQLRVKQDGLWQIESMRLVLVPKGKRGDEFVRLRELDAPYQAVHIPQTTQILC